MPVHALLLLLVIASLLIIVGFLLLLLSRGMRGEGRVEGGGVLIIGPIPIVLGTDQRVARDLILLALILMLVSALVFLLLPRALG